jgi:hypothetical protein
MRGFLTYFKSGAGRVTGAVAALALTVGLAVEDAFAQVTLPDTGTDMEGLMEATISALGSLVSVAVGAMFAFWIIRRALRWFRGV